VKAAAQVAAFTLGFFAPAGGHARWEYHTRRGDGMTDEFDIKQQRLQVLFDRRGLDGVILRRVSSFAWATCGGASYVNTAAASGAAALLITRDRRWVITDNVEAGRLEQEQGLAEQGWEWQVHPWHEPPPSSHQLVPGLKLGTDEAAPGLEDLSADLARLRAALTPAEGERMRALGANCAAAMQAAIAAVRPGQTEHQAAARLAAEAESRGLQPIVNLVAADERIFNFRHPLPSGKTLERYLMLVLCGRRHGLVCSITRLVHFGPLPEALRAKAQAVAAIDAAFIAATRPGAAIADIFLGAQRAYAEAGYADEWRLHHQGGPAGYEPREFVATPASTDIVSPGQAYAWNPSITGTKSEDTILVGESGNEVVTAIDGWPSLEATAGGQTLQRPAILEA
jgi:Xaa-Pro aminopeptidase